MPKLPVRQPLFKSLDSLILRVPDLQKGLDFYVGQLGHEVVWKTETAAGLAMPETDAELMLSTDTGPETNLLVDDVDAAYRRLIAAGAKEVRPPFEIQVGLCAVVEDPFGNELILLDLSKGTFETDANDNVIGVKAK